MFKCLCWRIIFSSHLMIQRFCLVLICPVSIVNEMSWLFLVHFALFTCLKYFRSYRRICWSSVFQKQIEKLEMSKLQSKRKLIFPLFSMQLCLIYWECAFSKYYRTHSSSRKYYGTPSSIASYILIWPCVSKLQVFHRLWHVSLLHSRQWAWLERGVWAIQIYWTLSCISRQTEAALADICCSSGSWLLFRQMVWLRRLIWGAHGKGKLAEALAEV